MSTVHSTVLCPEKYSKRVALMLTVLISRETEKEREKNHESSSDHPDREKDQMRPGSLPY